MQRVLIAYNPKAGASSALQRVEQLAALLRQSGFATTLEPDLAQFEADARRWHAQGELHGVVSAGGDGTAAAVANRLPAEVPIALYPLGTENLLARWLRQPATPEGVHAALTRGALTRFDAASANGRLFLIMLGAGFDAAVVQRAHELRTGHISRWHYFRPIREALGGYRFPPMRITATRAGAETGLPNQTETVPQPDLSVTARWAFVFNLPAYAGGLPIAPQAMGSDGALDLATFAGGSIWHGLRYLTGVILRQHHRLADHAHWRVTRLRIEADELIPYQLDGDPGGVLPVDIEVLPSRLSLFVPPAK